MKLFHVFTGVLLLATPAMAQTSNPRNILESDSIFSRVRGSQPTDSGYRPGTAPASSAKAPLFVGTFQEQDHYVAYLEVQTAFGSQLQKVKAGDTIPWDRSRVLEITPDRLQLSSDAPTARIVALGYDLLNNPISAEVQPATRPQVMRPFPSPLTRTRRTAPLATRPAIR